VNWKTEDLAQEQIFDNRGHAMYLQEKKGFREIPE
jgi:hypothetical protein